MTDFSNLQMVKVEIADFIATVTINNPPVNAQNQTFHEEMMLVFDTLSDMQDVRVAVLTGEGKCFSAGADIRARAGKEREAGDQWQHSCRARECFLSILECKKPVIGAINGPELGAGLAVAACCDILLAAEEARLGLPEINVGLLGGGRHTMRLFGHSKTRMMMFTGQRLTGRELEAQNIVEKCVPLAELMPAAMVLAKHSLNTIEDMSLRDGYRFEQNMTAELGKYENIKEAMLSFAEKRKPVFKGK